MLDVAFRLFALAHAAINSRDFALARILIDAGELVMKREK